ncbi:hypothetical protein ACIB24_06225 [Spongisporangium articulatum]|uniref:DUF7847 domain-containing protein n=1 Tax=Spongisporangium articulatum TaxID=3362603 RepID=A0ABW8AM10_9ACTN
MSQPWSAPGGEPDPDQGGPGTTPAGWGAPPPPPPAQPGWGPPPPPPSGWGAPPAAAGWGTPPPPPQGWSGATSGIVPMRPLSLGDIYDGAIRAIRANPRTMVGFSAVVIAIFTVLLTLPQAAFTGVLQSSPLLDWEPGDRVRSEDVADLVGASSFGIILPVVTQAIVTTVITALLITAVDRAVRGTLMRPGELWAVTRRRVPAALGLAVLLVLIAMLVMAVAVVPGIVLLAAVNDTPVLGVLVLLVGVPAGLAALVSLQFGWFALAAPALLLENRSVFSALRRSAGLVRRSFWRVLGIGILTAIVGAFVSGFFTLPTTLISSLLGDVLGHDAYWKDLAVVAVQNTGQVIAGAVVYPFTAAVSALLYLDLRMRREGLDVQLMSGR